MLKQLECFLQAVLSQDSHSENGISESDSTFACPFCDFKTKYNKMFDRHVNSHYQCDMCEKTFNGRNSKRNFDRHMKSHEPKYKAPKLSYKK